LISIFVFTKKSHGPASLNRCIIQIQNRLATPVLGKIHSHDVLGTEYVFHPVQVFLCLKWLPDIPIHEIIVEKLLQFLYPGMCRADEDFDVGIFLFHDLDEPVSIHPRSMNIG